ncbi:patatin-like phospholipase [Flavobacterium cutihirudinis]|uniref:Patatin-like phospholipase n=1 Tax=Flavobacterium cutihirudinis TaxID=1265740 RepID=A0A3D9G152_9FLAO|nr:DUF3734 domain-containing protein [Flavobacterium cutihirudinis]RED26935.1 patatin-like phospholipase [Flavobacterium cutihirudinis]
MENTVNKGALNQKLIKRTILKVASLKRELEIEKLKNLENIKTTYIPKLDTDILRIDDVIKDYNFSRKTIDRMRAKGLKYSQTSPKSPVWIVRKNLEDFLKKDRHDR